MTMPGPKATDRTKGRAAAPNSPNAQTRARLAARQAEFTETNPQNGQRMHKPGSENRKK
jgi:hypothetical protein